MKKILSYWFLLLAFCLPVALNAQVEVEIGTTGGTSTNSYLPSYSFYNYSLTQQIYTDTEIGMAGTIESVAFYNGGDEKIRNYSMYMVQTNKNSFDNSTDWISVTAQDLVFTGNVTMAANSWTVIELDDPFVYDGSGNLAIIMDDNTGTYSSGMTCRVFDAPGMAIQVYSDGTNYDPFNPSSYSGTVMDVKNQIKLSITPLGNYCARPSSITISNVTSNSADVAWVSPESSWNFKYKASYDEEWTEDYGVTSDEYSLSNLSPNTLYEVAVQTICSNGDTSSWKFGQFRTPQTPASLPYSCDFTDATENSLWLTSSTGTNHFVIGEGTSYDGDGDMSLYISNDNIGTYAASSISDYAFAERIIDFGETPSSFAISVDWKASGNVSGSSIYSAVIAYLRDADEETPNGFPSYVNDYIQYCTLNQNWTHQDIQVTDVSGLKKLIFFTWGYTSAGATDVPAAIDNISIVETTCLTPDFYVSSVTSSSATVSWNGDYSSSYVVIYRPQGSGSDANTYINVTGDTTVTITDLSPATTYYTWVAQICNGDTSVIGFAHSFTTDCAIIEVTDENPFVQNFNSLTEGIPQCWDNTDGTTTTDSYKWAYYEQGETGACVRFNSYSNTSGNTNMLKTPVLNLTQVTEPQVTFSYKNPAGGDFSVYLSTDSGFTYTTPIASGLTNASSWTTANYALPDLTDASTVVIVFQATSNYGSGDAYIYLDNVIVNNTPTCPSPINLTATPTSSDTVILSWVDNEGELWDIIYGPTGFDIENSEVATIITSVESNPYAISGLAGGISYDFYVRRDCGGGDISPWSTFPASASPYTIVMGVTGTSTVSGCGMTITDDGGASGNYSNNCNYTLTIMPGDPDSLLTISGIFAGESSLDYLSIYDGTTATEANLIEKVYSTMNGGTSGSQINFGPYTSETGPLTLLFHSDGSVVYPGFVATTSCVPVPTCIKPSELTVNTIGVDAATVSWAANENSVGYNVVISTNPNFDPDTCTEVYITNTNEYEFLDLNSNTNYYVAVQTDCGNDDLSAWSNIFNFLTLAGEPAETPYFCDFSDEEENSAWVLINGTQTNKWYIGTPSNETDTVLFISNNGTTESYTITSTSNVWAYRDIHFGDAAEFELDITWKANGESCCDYLKVYLGPATTVTAGSLDAPATAVALSGNLNVQTGYQHLTYAMDGSYSNTTQRLYFLWHNDGSLGTDPAAVIDEITISSSQCGRPYGLAVETLGSSTADISFNAAMDGDNAWDYALCVGNELPDTAAISGEVTDTIISFSDLDPATTYTLYVRTLCDVEEYSGWSTPITFTTACVYATLPIEENFDSYSNTGSNVFPNCWSRYNTYSTTSYYPYISSSYSVSGNKSLYFYATTATYDIAVLPSFDVTVNPINTLQISFMLRSTYLTNGIIVGVMDNPEAPNTFVPVDTLYPSIINDFDYLQTNFSNYEGEGQYVALKTIYGSSAAMYLDDLVLETIPSCPRPLSLTCTDATTTSITLSWQESGDATEWNIEYGPAGFTQGNGTVVAANSNPFTVDNLTPTTTYNFYVQSVCGTDDMSPWSFVCSANTTMEATPLPYATDFSDPDDAWILNNGTCPNYWTRGSANGTNALFITNDGTTPGYNISSYSVVSAQKLFTVGTDATITIQFDVQVGGESSWDYLKLFLAPASNVYPASTTAPQSSDYGYNAYSEYAYNFYANNYGTQSSYPYVMNLTSGNTIHVIAIMQNPNANPDANSTAQLVFAWKNDASSGVQPGAIISNLAIGDITCPQPTNLTVSNIGMTSANVTWTAGGDETAWNFEYKEASADNWTVVPVTTNSYQLTGLTSNTSYLVRVQANCSATDQSIYTSANFSTAACEVADQCTYTFILEDDYGDGWNNGYLTIEQNGIIVHTLELTNGYTATETINFCDNVSTSLVWHSGQYDDEAGFTITGPDGNQIYTISDMEDYTTFTFTTDCSGSGPGPVITDPTVATTAANAIEQTTATLNATITNPDNVTITAKGFEWKATTGGTYTQIAGTGTGNTFTANLTGLTPNTGYTYKAFITYNGTTVYGNEMTFTTLEQGVEPCDVPTGLTASNITHESFELTWNNNADVSSWNVRYRPQNGQWSSSTVNTNQYTVTGLFAETTYDVQVQANCGNNNLSEWTDLLTVTTLPNGIDNHLLNNIVLYPNPAKEYVDVRIDGDVNVTALEVFDVYGKLINTVNVIDNPTRINVSGLANGMYFVRVITEQGVATKTFVKK